MLQFEDQHPPCVQHSSLPNVRQHPQPTARPHVRPHVPPHVQPVAHRRLKSGRIFPPTGEFGHVTLCIVCWFSVNWNKKIRHTDGSPVLLHVSLQGKRIKDRRWIEDLGRWNQKNDLEVPCFWSLAVSKDTLSYWLRSWGERPKQNNCGTIRNQVYFDAPMQRCFFPMYLLSSWFCLFTSARHSLPVAGSGSKSSQKRFHWSFRPADPSRISSGLAQLKLKNKLTISFTDIISVPNTILYPQWDTWAPLILSYWFCHCI